MHAHPTTSPAASDLDSVPVRDGVDKRVKVERRQVRVLCLDVDHRGVVIPGEVHMQGQAVVEVREGDAVLCANGLSDDDLVDVVELIPVFISES